MSSMETSHRESGSPWKILLIGCLGVVLLGAVGLGFLAYKGVRMASRVATQMQQPAPPADPRVVAAKFAGIPIYPGAQLDAAATGQMGQMSQAIGKELGALGGAAMAGQASAVYRVSASPADVAAWYDQSMNRLGWSTGSKGHARPGKASGTAEQRSYEKAGVTLMVMVSGGTSGGAEMHLMLMGAPAGPGKTP